MGSKIAPQAKIFGVQNSQVFPKFPKNQNNLDQFLIDAALTTQKKWKVQNSAAGENFGVQNSKNSAAGENFWGPK